MKYRLSMPGIVLISYLCTFIASRLLVAAIYAGRTWGGFLFVHHMHVHHFNYGILLLVFVGGVGVCDTWVSRKVNYFLAALYGIGLGLICDEWGMLLELKDDYYSILSYAVVALFALLFGFLSWKRFRFSNATTLPMSEWISRRPNETLRERQERESDDTV